MLLDVIKVSTQEDFKLIIEFENGERRFFDMKPLWPLKPWNRISSRKFFQNVRVEYGSIVWPGNIDISPETLYEDSTPMQMDKE
jgi:hypothetical protein